VSLLHEVAVTYQAPNGVQQVQHGDVSRSSSSNGGTEVTSGPFPETITEVLIGGRYYEADTIAGATPAFRVAQQCKTDSNTVATYVLDVLRAIASSGTAQASGSTYTFRIQKKVSLLVPTTGMATVRDGFVRTLSFNPRASAGVVTIGSINSAPPVTAPASSRPMTRSCGP
jgi:hypothetical protein